MVMLIYPPPGTQGCRSWLMPSSLPWRILTTASLVQDQHHPGRSSPHSTSGEASPTMTRLICLTSHEPAPSPMLCLLCAMWLLMCMNKLLSVVIIIVMVMLCYITIIDHTVLFKMLCKTIVTIVVY